MAVRRVSKVDDFFDASQCLEIVEKTVEEFDSDPSNTRALDSLDIFAGKGNFCAECQAGGKTSMTVDILHDKKNHDILTRTGFFYVLQCILTMVEYGMILCGPPCGLFVFLSASYHRRSMDFPYGDQSKPKIRGGKPAGDQPYRTSGCSAQTQDLLCDGTTSFIGAMDLP
ncbi:unnamed protein product [Durusdinium trenchii]|uniref:Uncharacterized protein n=1 Tax=Durusdinium trenchii TaxID=1381693 RepID=A0ABP0IJ55_9DINO